MTTDAEEHACRIATARQMIIDLNEAFKVLAAEGITIDAEIVDYYRYAEGDTRRTPELKIKFLKDCE